MFSQQWWSLSCGTIAIVLVAFLITLTKHPPRSNLREEGLVLPSSPKRSFPGRKDGMRAGVEEPARCTNRQAAEGEEDEANPCH